MFLPQYRRLRLMRLLGLIIFTLSLLSAGSTLAQDDLRLSSLSISLWPEYDRPDVLVIYRGQLPPDASLPRDLTFYLPARVENLNAVAFTRENGRLVNATYETNTRDNALVLTFSASSPGFQFEYYDPGLLAVRDGERTLSFDTLLDYDVDDLQLEVQEPVQTQELVLSPAAANTITGQDSLRYHQITIGEARKGEPVALNVSYQRETDELSSGAFAVLESPSPPAPSPLAIEQEPALGYWLIGVGAVLLLGAGSYWFWSSQRLASLSGQPVRRAPRRRRRPERSKPPRPAPPPPGESVPAPAQRAAFCYQCGTQLRAGANFCFQCGAPRRS